MASGEAPGGAPGGHHPYGGFQSPAWMNGDARNPAPHPRWDALREMGHGASLQESGEMGRMTTLVAQRTVIRVPAETEPRQPTVNGENDAAATSQRSQSYDAGQAAAGSRPVVNGQYAGADNTYSGASNGGDAPARPRRPQVHNPRPYDDPYPAVNGQCPQVPDTYRNSSQQPRPGYPYPPTNTRGQQYPLYQYRRSGNGN